MKTAPLEIGEHGVGGDKKDRRPQPEVRFAASSGSVFLLLTESTLSSTSPKARLCACSVSFDIVTWFGVCNIWWWEGEKCWSTWLSCRLLAATISAACFFRHFVLRFWNQTCRKDKHEGGQSQDVASIVFIKLIRLHYFLSDAIRIYKRNGSDNLSNRGGNKRKYETTIAIQTMNHETDFRKVDIGNKTERIAEKNNKKEHKLLFFVY